MKPLLAEIPNEPRPLAQWLERHIVGLNLRQLVDELQEVAPLQASGQDTPSLEVLLEGKLDEVLRRGLGSLEIGPLTRLLLHPERLLELQEQALVHGGAYWDNVPLADKHLAAVERGQAVLELASDRSVARNPNIRRWSLLVAGLAASVAFAIGLRPFLVSAKPSWGFGRADILASTKRNGAYLRELADAARQWRAKRPANAQELAARLDQFVAGCDALIASTKTQLTNADDRTWLTAKCRDWRNALAAHATVARDAGRFATTLEEADGTVDKLIEALEQRAKTITQQT